MCCYDPEVGGSSHMTWHKSQIWGLETCLTNLNKRLDFDLVFMTWDRFFLLNICIFLDIEKLKRSRYPLPGIRARSMRAAVRTFAPCDNLPLLTPSRLSELLCPPVHALHTFRDFLQCVITAAALSQQQVCYVSGVQCFHPDSSDRACSSSRYSIFMSTWVWLDSTRLAWFSSQ